jgi:hypothetical protein
MKSISDPHGERLSLGTTRSLILWILFFLISFGLGYPTLNRYDARTADTDVISYYKMVANDPTLSAADDPFRFRVLVPSVAKPFYLAAKGNVGTWNPVFFGLLISNCLFTATATLFLLLIAIRVLKDLPTALLGCSLFLLNYVVSNLWLSGLVDSSEGCLLLAVTWCLFSRRWWLLPIIGIVGGVAKQSFLPFSLLFAATWWMTTERSRRTYTQLLWMTSLAVTATTSLVFAHWKIAGQLLWPWAMATWWDDPRYGSNFVAWLTDYRFWYAFVWLVPLGIWRLNRFPKPWLAASLVTALFALGLAVYANLGGSVNRPVFNVIGPILSLSAAHFISTWKLTRRLPEQDTSEDPG